MKEKTDMNESFMKEKPVFPLLVSMALPMVISMLVNSLYNIIDSFFVAKISEDAMTALSLVYPVQNFVNAVAIGFGVGINALIALYLGAGDKNNASRAATHGVLFAGLHGIVVMVVSIAIMPSFLAMFTRDKAVITLGIRYSTIVFGFSVIVMLGLSFEKIFQAVGRMKVAMASLLAGCVTNIILDPLLIFGIGIFPKLGISGAALATGIGQVVTLLVYLTVYKVCPLPVHLGREYLTPKKEVDLKLYTIGIPAILNLALPSFLISFLNAILAAYAQSYVVILGIYYKLQTFLYLPANGIIQGMRPLIGYNYGAGEEKRVKKIYDLTLGMCGVIMALGTVVCQFASKQLIHMFTDNPATVVSGGMALRIISIGFLVSAVSVTASGALEGLGKGAQSLVISLFRYIIFIIPIAYLLCRTIGPDGVWHAFWITEILTAVVAAAVYRRSVKKNHLNIAK